MLGTSSVQHSLPMLSFVPREARTAHLAGEPGHWGNLRRCHHACGSPILQLRMGSPPPPTPSNDRKHQAQQVQPGWCYPLETPGPCMAQMFPMLGTPCPTPAAPAPLLVTATCLGAARQGHYPHSFQTKTEKVFVSAMVTWFWAALPGSFRLPLVSRLATVLCPLI